MATTINEVRAIRDYVDQIIGNVEQVIVGKREQIEFVLMAMLCQGHVLLEDVPGTGKTMLARALAVSMGMNFKRVQCTPDLLPNDIVGVSIYNQKTLDFEFRSGPVFANILLADEINRATPRTQSALLEAMQELQVSSGGQTYPLPLPFLVLATQNPIEFEGTFPLPEAQLDRFLMRLSVGYPNVQEEIQVLRNNRQQHPISTLKQVVDGYQLTNLSAAIGGINVDSTIEAYILAIISATRTHADLALGASPRGSLALYKSSQAFAALKGRDYVIPEDVKTMAPLTLAHRLILKPESELRGRTCNSVLADILEKTELKLS